MLPLNVSPLSHLIHQLENETRVLKKRFCPDTCPPVCPLVGARCACPFRCGPKSSINLRYSGIYHIITRIIARLEIIPACARMLCEFATALFRHCAYPIGYFFSHTLNETPVAFYSKLCYSRICNKRCIRGERWNGSCFYPSSPARLRACG